LLREKESYGYELIDRVNNLPFSDSLVDPGAVYRTLRQMEREGLVKSEWSTKESGPARRIYRITGDGEDRLYGWVANLKRRKEAIVKFLKRYEGR
jgi:poly-beta-hydroxybutyrate-responsive repressor